MVNQWREVCRWDVGDGSPTFAPHENEPTTTRETWLGTMWERTQADVTLLLSRCRDGEVLIDSLIACYEELAGEHRELWEAFMRDAEALSTPCPGDPEDYTFVRAYYRPRRSKLAAIEPDHPTVQAAPGEGQSGASGDVVGASIDCPECDLVFASLEEYGDHYRNLHSGHPLTEVARVSVEHGPEWYGEERSE